MKYVIKRVCILLLINWEKLKLMYNFITNIIIIIINLTVKNLKIRIQIEPKVIRC